MHQQVPAVRAIPEVPVADAVEADLAVTINKIERNNEKIF
jgi:hypothetical protein